MRVAINAQLVAFGDSFRNAGISRYIYTLLEGLGRLDGDQRYTAFIGPREAASAARSPLAGMPNVRLAPSRRSTTGAARRIAWEQLALPGELRRAGADVFHAPANVLPGRVPCASVVTVLDLAFIRYPRHLKPTRRIYQRVMTPWSVRRATLVATISESTKRDLIELMRVPGERIEVIYPSLSPDFRPVADPAALAAFRATRGLPERYLLYLGTLEPRKNLVTLIEAYAKVRAAEPDVPPLLLAGGKGWYYEPIFAKVRALGLERAITFVGYVSREEQPLWYSGSAAFIYPSLYEGFGLPVLEALACGAPTITSNVSSLPEAAGAVAMQVAPRDGGELAHAMLTLLRDDAARARMAAEGPRWAGAFTTERMARGYAALYRRAADGFAKRRGEGRR